MGNQRTPVQTLRFARMVPQIWAGEYTAPSRTRLLADRMATDEFGEDA